MVVALRRPVRRGRAHDRPAVPLDRIADLGAGAGEICARALRIVDGGVPLLIEGPAGSGKESLARALHASGPCAARPFQIVACHLIEETALRTDLAAGAGVTRLAGTRGTLCLDGPDRTPREAQPLLAQALAHLERTGAAPVQVMALCSGSLAERTLHPDLHDRLAAAAMVRRPGLAERREDIPRLVRRFADLYAGGRTGGTLRFTPAAMDCLQAHGWAGNLRELRTVVEALSAVSPDRLVDLVDLPPGIARARRDGTLRERERAAILTTVAATGGNMAETARRLGISRSTLYLKLAQYGLPRGRRH